MAAVNAGGVTEQHCTTVPWVTCHPSSRCRQAPPPDPRRRRVTADLAPHATMSRPPPAYARDARQPASAAGHGEHGAQNHQRDGDGFPRRDDHFRTNRALWFNRRAASYRRPISVSPRDSGHAAIIAAMRSRAIAVVASCRVHHPWKHRTIDALAVPYQMAQATTARNKSLSTPIPTT